MVVARGESLHPLLPPLTVPTLEQDGGGAACSTLLGLCPPPDSSDSELELSTVRHQPEGLDQLQAQTKFTKKELQSLYRGFKNVSAPHLPRRGPDPPGFPVPGCRMQADLLDTSHGTVNIPGPLWGSCFVGELSGGWARS